MAAQEGNPLAQNGGVHHKNKKTMHTQTTAARRSRQYDAGRQLAAGRLCPARLRSR